MISKIKYVGHPVYIHEHTHDQVYCKNCQRNVNKLSLSLVASFNDNSQIKMITRPNAISNFMILIS